MKEVKFQDLKIDDEFTLNGIEYKKAQDQRVSCCKVLNAVDKNNPGNKVQIKPLTIVQVND